MKSVARRETGATVGTRRAETIVGHFAVGARELSRTIAHVRARARRQTDATV